MGRPLVPYDLLWPVVYQRAQLPPGKVTEGAKEQGKRTSIRAVPAPPAKPGTYEDLQTYARNLLASFPDPKATGVRIKLPIEAVQHGNGDVERELDGDMDSPAGCRQAVEVLTRNPKKGTSQFKAYRERQLSCSV